MSEKPKATIKRITLHPILSSWHIKINLPPERHLIERYIVTAVSANSSNHVIVEMLDREDDHLLLSIPAWNEEYLIRIITLYNHLTTDNCPFDEIKHTPKQAFFN